MKECSICGEEAGKSERYPDKDLCCQRCGELLCDNCAVYGYDNMQRCEGCHFEQMSICENECRGDMEKHHCKECAL
jgi:hypothetical protein